jgi:ubiquinone/menaquinone biosynthesis C-methylase UbiE
MTIGNAPLFYSFAMKRMPSRELLDTDSGTQEEIAASLADLRMINRCFGGIATTGSLIRRVARKLNHKSLTVLEVAAGSGDAPRLAAQCLQQDGVRLDLTLLDRAQSHLSYGQNGNRGAASVVGDALALPFADASFDLVGCNLFVHHLATEEVIQFVNEGLRVCRTAVVINDLVRHRLHLSFVYAGLPLFRSRITRHDTRASVRQAYTVEEMRCLLRQTPAAQVEIHRHYLFRMGVIAWKSF